MTAYSTSNLIYLGNFATTDSYEGDYKSEYANNLVGVSRDHTEMQIVTVGIYDKDHDGVMEDDECNPYHDYITYDTGSGSTNQQTDSSMELQVTLTLADGSTTSVKVVAMQMQNGDLFISDLYNNGTLDNLEITNVEITQVTGNNFSGWYTNQSVDNTSIVSPVTPDGIVEGTASNDLIDVAYTGDPEGDMVDNNDAILPGAAPNDDFIQGFAGDDTIKAGEGDDSVEGGADNDLIFGEAGSDTLKGDGGHDTIYGGNGPDGGSGGVSESDIDPVSLNFTDVRSGSETNSSNNASAGDSVIYDNVATLPDGTEVSARLVLVSTSNNSLQIDMANNSDYEILLNANNDSGMQGETATFRMEFFDTATGDPVELEPGIVFADLDQNVGQEVLTITDDNLVNVGTPTVSSLDVTYDGDDLSVAGTEDNIDPNEGDSQIATVFSTTSSIEFTLTSRGVNSGTNFGTVDGQDFNYVNPFASGDDEGDSILGGEGNDLIYGQGGSDTIDGEAGDDTIYGGGPETTSTHEIFKWSEGPGFANNANTPNFTQDTGNANITFTTVSQSSGVETEYETSTQDVSELDAEVGSNSSLSSILNGDPNSAKYQWESDTPLENVEFRVNDIDGDGRIVVRAWDENGDPIEVTLSDAGSGLALSNSDSVPGNDTATSIDNNYTSDSNPEHSVLVNIEGPVSRWEILHEQDGSYNSGINVTDITFDVPSTIVDDDNAGDSLIGGDGDDHIFGQGGDDTITGGDGQDNIDGGTGNDSIDASSDDAVDLPDLGFPAYGPFPAVPADPDPENDRDFVDAGSGNDTVVTGDDADTILGGSGDDSIDAGVDTDSIEGGSGEDTIIGGEGNDTIDGGDDDDVIYGGLDPSFPDYLNIPDDGHGGVIPDPETDNGRDLIDGGAGNDTIFGQDDDDTISGGTGNDVIDGGVDEDSITGGEGNDALTGGHGDDTIHGNEGDDTIHGGIGADSLTGGEGDDSFTLGGGDGAGDYAAGGDDQDTFTNIGAGDTIDGNEGGVDYDTLDLTGAGEANNPGGSYSVEYSALNPEDGIVKFFDAGGTLTGTAEFYNIENVICFTPGTAILTPSGEIAVEELKVGDRVVTRDNGLQTIRWIGRKPLTGRDLLSRPKLRPIMIRKGSLGPNLPDRDMMVSPNHRMLLVSQQAQLLFEESEVLVAAKHLVHMDGVHQVDTTGVEYIHFLCDHHEVVLANGAWSESFQPGEFSMGGIGQEQRAEIYELFPELQDRETLENFSAARLTLKRHEAKLLG
ncbi:Hint domain-containing protein [Shimia sp. CNT1-13L.2]|uniref:Hint domain-containing protein n=1 Tax=Shimia sp. CNT1-13L.2 TaxID=2959663 RepID=UPI0020CC06A9|nr:Hint domain-containing protein [Shimia sp. CNT1-13L.2]MCP9480819.1 Hint domain-containing protein [Shimia sp. CNT1-13L.2]